MATAGQDFGDYRQWLDAAGIDTSLVKSVDGKFTRVVLLQHRPAQQPDRVVLHRRDGQRRRAVVPRPPRLREPGHHLAQRSRRRWCSTPRSAARSASSTSGIPGQQCARMDGDAAERRHRRRTIVICNDYEFELIRQKTGTGRSRRAGAVAAAGRHQGEHGLHGDHRGRARRRAGGAAAIASRIRPASATRSAAAS